MSLSVFESINHILTLWKILIQVILFLVLWNAAFGRKKRKRDGAAAVLLILLNVGLGILPCAAWIRYVVSAFLIMGYSGGYKKKQVGKAMFVMSVFYNLHCLSYLIASSIYEKIIGGMIKNLDMMQDHYQEAMYHCTAVGMVCLVSSYSVLFAAMAVILRRIIKDTAEMTWQDILLLSVLNFVGSMTASVAGSLLIVRTDRDTFMLFDEKPELLWKIPMIALCIFAGEAALIYFWQKYRILISERQKHFVEEQQVKAMKKRLEETENFYGNIRKVRHEMKNHMANIQGLAQAGRYGEIGEYVRKMDAVMEELEYQYVTGNAVTDVIINDKWRRAKKAGIRFEADFRYGGEIPVFDLGIILNNLLDNAMEACEKLEPGKGFIRLTLKRRKQFLLLDVENSFDGAVPVQKEDSFPQTTKQSVLPGLLTEHGIGLENVRDMAERYFGGVNIKVKGNIFHVTIMLQYGEMGK